MGKSASHASWGDCAEQKQQQGRSSRQKRGISYVMVVGCDWLKMYLHDTCTVTGWIKRQLSTYWVVHLITVVL